VVEQIRKLAHDPSMVEQVHAEAEKQRKAQVRRLKAERSRLQRERQHKQERIRELAAVVGQSNEPLTALTSSLTELDATLGQIDGRLSQISQELSALQKDSINRSDLETALAMFGPVWEELYVAEKSQLIKAVIGLVDYDGSTIKVRLRYGT